MNYPSVRQWLLFDAICRCRSLTKAAAQLALSQPAASQALQELESRLGYPLFLRQNRQLLPTQAALDLLPGLTQMLQLQQQLVSSPAEQGELRLAASETIGCYLLPAILARFTARYPACRFSLQLGNSSEVQQQLRQQQAQLGLIEGPLLSSEFSVSAWRQDELVLVGSPQHHAMLRQPSTLQQQQLLASRWIVRERGSGTRAVLEHELSRHGWTPAQVLELQRPEAIKQSVKQGLGIGCLPWLTVQDELEFGQLVLLPHPLQLRRQLSLLCHPGYQPPLLQRFVEFLQQEVVASPRHP